MLLPWPKMPFLFQLGLGIAAPQGPHNQVEESQRVVG